MATKLTILLFAALAMGGGPAMAQVHKLPYSTQAQQKKPQNNVQSLKSNNVRPEDGKRPNLDLPDLGYGTTGKPESGKR